MPCAYFGPSLKAVAFEARELAKVDGDNAIWRGVGDAADRRREILSLYRSGKGVWHATIDISRWDVTRRYSEPVNSFHERHDSKKEAEDAARRMLAERFNSSVPNIRLRPVSFVI
jgi:hypothetical protein